MALPAETLLIRWFNYHLKAAGSQRRVANFGKDIKDSECYTILIKQIAPAGSGVDTSALGISDETERAERMLQQADKIGCRKFVRPAEVVKGNQKLNLAFVANMFNTHPALDVPANIDVEELEEIEENRDEKTFRNWMNSLGVNPFVNNLYQDLRDGLVLVQLLDKVQPGLVDWKRVNQPPWKAIGGNMKKIENSNYVLELCKQKNFSLVSVPATRAQWGGRGTGEQR
jgi:plastin-2